MVPALEVEDLAVAYGPRRVLDGVTLRLEPGARHALIGANGAGKSTLLAAIGGWVAPQRGHVRLNGQTLTRLPPDRRARLGLASAPQLPLGFPRLSVADHLRAAFQRGRGWARYAPWVEKAVRSRAIRLALGPLDARAAALPHGHRKRLDLEVALIGKPAVVLLDEPTAGLGPREREIMVDRLRGLKAALLIVEHDMDVVAALANWVSVLHGGRIVAQGPPEQVAQDACAQDVYLGHARR